MSNSIVQRILDGEHAGIIDWWSKETIEMELGRTLSSEQWVELIKRLYNGSFSSELQNLVIDYIREELDLMNEEVSE